MAIINKRKVKIDRQRLAELEEYEEANKRFLKMIGDRDMVIEDLNSKNDKLIIDNNVLADNIRAVAVKLEKIKALLLSIVDGKSDIEQLEEMVGSEKLEEANKRFLKMIGDKNQKRTQGTDAKSDIEQLGDMDEADI